MRLSRRSFFGFLAAAPITGPTIAAVVRETPLVTVGADIQAEGMSLTVVEWSTIPVDTVCTPDSIRASIIDAFGRFPSRLAVHGGADGLLGAQAAEAA